jgi:hypothetical protein
MQGAYGIVNGGPIIKSVNDLVVKVVYYRIAIHGVYNIIVLPCNIIKFNNRPKGIFFGQRMVGLCRGVE